MFIISHKNLFVKTLKTKIKDIIVISQKNFFDYKIMTGTYNMYLWCKVDLLMF